MTQLNSKGYTMRLIDSSGMVVVHGCSREAVIDGDKDYMLVHHGVSVMLEDKFGMISS